MWIYKRVGRISKETKAIKYRGFEKVDNGKSVDVKERRVNYFDHIKRYNTYENLTVT